ncbi:Alpha/Beta hydrolase protein [Pelagophyceae sp. CCMP2097]|nr:Alpha/Beta hydrolase protein [Pelagophyceae sp. CCMP2097]
MSSFVEGECPTDPHASLEVVLGEEPLKWVGERNAETVAALGDLKETAVYKKILGILDSKDKIPGAYRISDGHQGGRLYNFWQDDAHKQGIWRSCTEESYKTTTPEWRVALDVDALPPPTVGTAKSWVWHGSRLLHEKGKACDRALISLSPGGSDADTCREFCLVTETFVDVEGPEKGFALGDPAKTRISWRSRNECLVGTDFGGDGSTLTASGYPRIVKSWLRGTPLSEAKVVFEGEKADVASSMYAYEDRGVFHEFRVRSVTFYTSKYSYRRLENLETPASEEPAPFGSVPIPDDAEMGTFANLALITLRTDWATSGRTFKAGSLISVAMADVMRGEFGGAMALFEPCAAASLAGTTETKDFLILKVLEDVRTKLVFWRFNEGEWHSAGDGALVAVGEDVSVSCVSRAADQDNLLWLSRDGYLVPDTLELVDASDLAQGGIAEKVKVKPAMFEASNLVVDQHFATSVDGTKIPYFVVRRDDVVFDGGNPALLDAYGGFEISMTPGYSAGVGAGWLERGGIKVIANIRGGGEYGPAWHQAALKEKRHKAYEDVEAVAQDLIQRKITSPHKLAVIGGSNGGLLVGNMLTRPVASKLFGAAVCQVPLLDMQRYSHLLAGASWMAEYGDPDVAEEWLYLQRHSPYQLLRQGILGLAGADGIATEADSEWKCPKVLFTTSTRDDRVHPGHARKMVKALLDEAPKSQVPLCLYWENTEGGHGGAADNTQRAYMWAMTYTFLSKQLGLD